MLFLTTTGMYYYGRVFNKKLKVAAPPNRPHPHARTHEHGQAQPRTWGLFMCNATASPRRLVALVQFALPLKDVRLIEKKKNGLMASGITVATETAAVRVVAQPPRRRSVRFGERVTDHGTLIPKAGGADTTATVQVCRHQAPRRRLRCHGVGLASGHRTLARPPGPGLPTARLLA